ncbi:nitric oxide synthase oxygenase [Streptomyces sp. NPDC016845]|uniref:nitric oxide synthase oxygenase n=1 Tax=Streptomyces sp. NPDC016845 TaxID=3364972 RepID=UPI00379804B3
MPWWNWRCRCAGRSGRARRRRAGCARPRGPGAARWSTHRGRRAPTRDSTGSPHLRDAPSAASATAPPPSTAGTWAQRLVHGHRDRRPQPRTDRGLWKDRALVELNRAALHSFDRAGVTVGDHHTEPERFLAHIAREETKGRAAGADRSRIVPPISGSATRVFHRTYDTTERTPAYVHHPGAHARARVEERPAAHRPAPLDDRP